MKHQITLYLHAETDRAWMVNQSPLYNKPPTAHIWLPKSKCEEVSRATRRREGSEYIIGTEITLEIPMWLIEKNDLEGLL